MRKIIFLRNPRCAGVSIARFCSKHDLDIETISWKETSRFHKMFGSGDEKPIIFTIVRNPFDKVVSVFHYAKRHQWISQKMSFTDFCRLSLEDMRQPQNGVTKKGSAPSALWAYSMPFAQQLCDENGSIDYIDYILHQEALRDEFAEFCSKMGWPKHGLRFANATLRSLYKKYYTQETYKIIEERYAQDLQLLDYEFGLTESGFSIASVTAYIRQFCAYVQSWLKK